MWKIHTCRLFCIKHSSNLNEAPILLRTLGAFSLGVRGYSEGSLPVSSWRERHNRLLQISPKYSQWFWLSCCDSSKELFLDGPMINSLPPWCRVFAAPAGRAPDDPPETGASASELWCEGSGPSPEMWGYLDLQKNQLHFFQQKKKKAIWFQKQSSGIH